MGEITNTRTDSVVTFSFTFPECGHDEGREYNDNSNNSSGSNNYDDCTDDTSDYLVQISGSEYAPACETRRWICLLLRLGACGRVGSTGCWTVTCHKQRHKEAQFG
ncbi:hypothetical protein Pelo_11463 [Pelomyxa schiedti]|nr:hypothetical protein Pelo_11463 [Pelomyxa schiedti]